MRLPGGVASSPSLPQPSLQVPPTAPSTPIVMAPAAAPASPRPAASAAVGRSRVKVVSAGLDAGDVADFFLDDVLVQIPAGATNRRGVNVVVLSPNTGGVVSSGAYDIWGNPAAENSRLAADLNALPDGHVVLVALKDSGMENLQDVALAALEDCGARLQDRLGFREAYTLIGCKGGKALAERWGPQMLLSEADLPFQVVQPSQSLPTSRVNTGASKLEPNLGRAPVGRGGGLEQPPAVAAGGARSWEEVLQILEQVEAEILERQQAGEAAASQL